jgi:hypothetical protein
MQLSNKQAILIQKEISINSHRSPLKLRKYSRREVSIICSLCSTLHLIIYGTERI